MEASEKLVCYQFIALSNCTHPPDCKDYLHELLDNSNEEPSTDLQEIIQLQNTSSNKQDSTTNSSDKVQYSTSQQTTTETKPEKKEKKKLVYKKENSEFKPDSFFKPELSSQSVSFQPFNIGNTSNDFIPNTQYDNMNDYQIPQLTSQSSQNTQVTDFDPQDMFEKMQYDNYGYDDDLVPEDPDYIHPSSVDCDCCHGYINCCGGEICGNLGYCFCYAQEVEELH